MENTRKELNERHLLGKSTASTIRDEGVNKSD
jgi:hypothetical protein